MTRFFLIYLRFSFVLRHVYIFRQVIVFVRRELISLMGAVGANFCDTQKVEYMRLRTAAAAKKETLSISVVTYKVERGYTLKPRDRINSFS